MVDVVTVEKVVGMVVMVVGAPGIKVVIGIFSFGVTIMWVPNAAMYVWFSGGEQSSGLPLWLENAGEGVQDAERPEVPHDIRVGAVDSIYS